VVDSKPVPVIMFHSVGIRNKKWQYNFLTLYYRLFGKYLKWMKMMRFHSLFLPELYAYKAEGLRLPKNPVVLTFDDGFVDNWVFAYPLLKEYGFKGTFFVNPEFADPRNVMRKNLENARNGELKLEELKNVGFLSWEEMKVMEEEGVADIQSHTMTHTWYPNNNVVIDFRHPGDVYTWMTWNNNPMEKPYLQIDNKDYVNVGEPVYQYGRAIGVRRFFPDESLKEYLLHYVKEKSVTFFKTENWKGKLLRVVQDYKRENLLYERFETEKEYEERIFYELHESKKIIESKLNKEIKFLCWPGGAVTDKALKMASEVGYVMSTFSSRELSAFYVDPKTKELDPSRIIRSGSSLYRKGETTIHFPPPFFVLKLKLYDTQKTDSHLKKMIALYYKKRHIKIAQYGKA